MSEHVQLMKNRGVNMSIVSAQQFEENEEYEKAFEEYKKALETRPKDLEIIERLAHISKILNNNDDAELYYNKLLELDPKNELAHEQLMDIYIYSDKYKYYISRGNLHIIQGQISHALNDYKKALAKAENETQTATTRFVLATLYERLDKNNNAIDEYLRVCESEQSSEIAYLNLANVYLKEDAVSSAVETLERAIEKGFDSPMVKETLASLYLKSNNHEKSREVTSNELVKIKSYLDEGNDEKAYELLNNISEEYKKNPEYMILMAQYHFNKENWDESFKYVDEFAQTGKNPALVYQMKALIYEGKNMEFESHLYWARYNISRGNNDVALNEYYAAYKENDNDPQMIKELAMLLDDLGDKVQAGEFWLTLVKLDETDKKALEKAAEFKESIGAYREQIELLEKLYEQNKKNTIVIKKLAQAFEKTKQKQSALEYYKKYLENSLMDDEYERIKQKVQSMENTATENADVEDEGLIGKIMNLFAKK